MPSAADDIRSAIARAGTISFRDFMSLALYGEHGFYSQVGSAGRRGDFITSPEVGPLFGAVVARVLDEWWRKIGSPEDFSVVEVGSGPGTLARSVVAAKPECLHRGRYISVETSGEQRLRHPDSVQSVGEMPERIEHGVVVANELLDNLPFRLFVSDGGWREAFVTINEEGSFIEVLGERVETPRGFPDAAPLGTRLPLQEDARQWITQARSAVRSGGVLIFDYCTRTTSELVSIPWRDWLRTYRQHERGVHYLRDVGLQDITTQVCLDQLDLNDVKVSTQADFLRCNGINELVEEGRKHWEAHSARPDVLAMTMRSRIREAEALCDERGLGGFNVVEVSSTV